MGIKHQSLGTNRFGVLKQNKESIAEFLNIILLKNIKMHESIYKVRHLQHKLRLHI